MAFLLEVPEELNICYQFHMQILVWIVEKDESSFGGRFPQALNISYRLIIHMNQFYNYDVIYIY